MKPSLRRILSILIIVVSIAAVCFIAFGNNKLGDAWEALASLNPYWIAAAAGCFLLNFVSDSIALMVFLKHQGYRISFFFAMFIAVTGMYYSNITPGATGGQPMQIYEMNKKGIPVPIGTSALSVRLLGNQLMTVIPAIILWLINRSFVSQQLQGVKWIAVLSVALNAAIIPLIALIIFKRNLLARLVAFVVRIGAKLHLVKNQEYTMMKIETGLQSFHNSLYHLRKKPSLLFVQLLCSLVNMFSLLGIAVCVYFAFGENTYAWHSILTIAHLIFLSANYIPMPGGSGAQEGAFLLYMKGVFPAGTLNVALLVWRFFSFYLYLLVGVLVTVIGSILNKRRNASPQEKDAQPEAAADGQST